MRALLLALVILGLAAGPARAGNDPPGTGDVNGDGVADVLLTNDGVRVVFGRKGATGALRRARGFRIAGASANDPTERMIAGDVNGDRLDDIVLASRGSAYVVFGKRGTKTVDVRRLRSRGIAIRGPGLSSAAGVGDVDGDGLADVIVGAPERDGRGAAWVIAGRRGGGLLDVADAFLRIDGAASGDQEACDASNFESGDPPPFPPCTDNAGWSVAGPGDMNGDGIPDLALDAGRPSVVFGRRSGGTVDLGALGDGGYRISGVSAQTVHHVGAAGDVNGDGLADLTLADYGSYAGMLVFGSPHGDFDFRSPGERAVRLDTADGIDRVAGAGDFDGDGRTDLVTIGLRGNDGAVFVAFGAPRSGRMRFGGAGWRGVRIITHDNEEGAVVPDVDPVGDVNGDGRDDLLVIDGDGTPRVVLGARGEARLTSTRLGRRGLRLR